MNYTISEDKLFEVFSKYMDKRFTELYVSDFDYILFLNPKDNQPVELGHIGYNRDSDQFMFSQNPRHNQMFMGFKNTFGDVFDDMFLKYLQTKFPEYNIEGMY